MTEPLPVWCGELELFPRPAAVPVPGPGTGGPPPASVRTLLRLHGEPLGFATAPVGEPLSVDRALEQLGEPARQRVLRSWAGQRDGANAGPPVLDASGLSVTVAVCTRERAATLAGCLEHLQRVTYSNTEILVVDNAPRSTATRDVVAEAAARDPRIRYTSELRPGLSRARNAALAEARGDVVAYTDDDVRVDPGWVDGLVRGFSRRPDVACVTGLVASAGVETAVEAYFESRVSWATIRGPRLYDLQDNRDASPMYPFAAGLFGTGANFAFRRAELTGLHGFDEDLGAGAATRGGEDLDVFLRVLLAGYTIAHEPSALVWHHHRSDLRALEQQMFGYGTGLTAFYAKHLLDRASRGPLLRVVPQGVRRLASVVRSATVSAADHPDSTASSDAIPASSVGRELHRRLVVRQLAGMVAGPLLLGRARLSR